MQAKYSFSFGPHTAVLWTSLWLYTKRLLLESSGNHMSSRGSNKGRPCARQKTYLLYYIAPKMPLFFPFPIFEHEGFLVCLACQVSNHIISIFFLLLSSSSCHIDISDYISLWFRREFNLFFHLFRQQIFIEHPMVASSLLGITKKSVKKQARTYCIHKSWFSWAQWDRLQYDNESRGAN